MPCVEVLRTMWTSIEPENKLDSQSLQITVTGVVSDRDVNSS